MAPALRSVALALALVRTVAGAAQGQAARASNLRQLSDVERAQADAASVLTALLKRLQAEQGERAQASSERSQWCSVASTQKTSIEEAIQRRLDEAAIELRQISSDSKRLDSEMNLVQSTEREQKQQLVDASSTEQFAVEEFASEQRQVEQTVEAAHHAIRLLTSHNVAARSGTGQAADVGAVSNLMQLGAEGMTDAERQIMSSYVDPKPAAATGSAAPRPQELLQTLRTLTKRLEEERDSGRQERERMARKLWAFGDHLNVSMVETRSQAAAIDMELAQRKRERTRLTGKTTDLAGLLKAVEASKATTAVACQQETAQDVQMGKYLAAELDSVRLALEQLSPDGSDVFLELPGSPSFLQIKQREAPAAGPARYVLGDLADLAQQFPEDSAWYIDKAQALALSGARRTPTAAEAVPSARQSSPAGPGAAGSGGSASAALRDIQQFADSETSPEDAASLAADRSLPTDPEQVRSIKGIYQNLLAKVQNKEQGVSNHTSFCQALVRDAKVDGAAMGRSMKRMDAKLNLVKVAMLEYEKGSKYNVAQSKTIEALGKQLGELAKRDDQRGESFYRQLNSFGQQLRNLVMQLGQEPSEEQRRGAELVRGLEQKILNHQGLLQSWRQVSAKRRDSVERADKAVQTALLTDVKHNNRRMVRLKAELSFLTSLSHAKANDKTLGERFRELSGNLCSADRMKKLQAEDAALRKQATTLQKSYSSDVAPFA